MAPVCVVALLALFSLIASPAEAAFGDRPLRQGKSGHDVRVLQSWLTHLGHAAAVDGRFGPATTRSVRSYERAEKLRVDGRVSRIQARGMRKRVEGPNRGSVTRRQTKTTPATDGLTFPVGGSYDIGRSAGNGFGGGRNHQGHDIFAACGTPLVAVTSGSVQQKAYQAAAGHYVVLRDESGQSFAYMHLRSASPLATGDPVTVGQVVGRVGRSGRASGCHLHFERWTAPGWYTGGRAVDPLPLLRRLEAGG
jgi:murein DD-endopeptidase MepM/ murein hydrolase activator NlpD